MIAYFPAAYPDELLYSQLARYYTKSGYMAYTFAAEELFASKTVRPDMDFINSYTPAAIQAITRNISMEVVIEKHTMFSCYGRFLLRERRQKAFQSLVSMMGNYYNLLPIPQSKNGKVRCLRYCPTCAANDREQYGEAYWHRIHQIIATESLLNGYTETAPKQATTTVSSQANKTPEEVLYKGKTITNWIGARPRQKPLQDEFGALVATGQARGGDYRSYDGITFFVNVQRDEIVSIGGTNLELFTVNEATLDKDRAGLIRIFGNPQKEGQVMVGDDEGSYYMAYDYMGYSLAFYRSSPDGKVEWFEISNKKD